MCVLLWGLVISSQGAMAGDGDDWRPELHGTVRAKYEYQPPIDAGRFEVRNARFSLSGQVSPIVSYKAEIDLSDEGSIKMLDAYSRIRPIEHLNFTIGQMRVPFTIDAHRSPHQQYFANRSFIAKQTGNVRDVGAVVAYHLTGSLPIVLEAGLFNGSGLTNQKDFWTSNNNYALKAQLTLPAGFGLVLSSQRIRPVNIPVFLYDAGLFWEGHGWHIEAEYLHKYYSGNAFSRVNAFDGFICYDLPLRRVFRKVSFLGRFDCMSNHSDGVPVDGRLVLTDSERKRITGGITLSLQRPFISDIRINYEKYFYPENALIHVSEQDKFVIEFMTRF